MIAIVMKRSTYNRVKTQLRYRGYFEDFTTFVSRVCHDSDGTYLYFDHFCNLCSASIYLAALNAVYCVVEASL